MDTVKYFISLFLIIYPVSYSYGQNLSFHGFVQGNYNTRITGLKLHNSESGDYILGEERIQFTLSGYSESGNTDFFVKSDFFHDAVIDNVHIDIREAYIDYIANSFDLRIGRQIVTWGVGDLLFINDIFPKDWNAFFSGRPLEYMKIGSDAFKLNLYSSIVSAELIAMPFFREDELPSAQRFFLYDPFPQIETRNIVRPEKDINKTEIALRIYRQIENFDLSVYTYKGFFRSPGTHMDSFDGTPFLNYFYPGLAVYGFSVTRGLLQGVLSSEAGYYDSLDDNYGTDPGTPNSLTKFLVSYQRQLWSEFNFTVQFYGEFMHNYDSHKINLPAGFPLQDEIRQIVTLRFTKFLKYQTLKLSLFSFYSPTDDDFMIIPEINYKISDNLWTAIGSNLFGGKKDYTFFGQFNKNDNIYAVIRFEF